MHSALLVSVYNRGAVAVNGRIQRFGEGYLSPFLASKNSHAVWERLA